MSIEIEELIGFIFLALAVVGLAISFWLDFVNVAYLNDSEVYSLNGQWVIITDQFGQEWECLKYDTAMDCKGID